MGELQVSKIHTGRYGAGSDAPVSLNREEALGYLGYAGQSVDDQLLARFDQLADACDASVQPAYAWAAFPVDAANTRWDETDGDPQVALSGCRLVLPGRDIAAHLRGAWAVALMACTLGMANERDLRKHAAVSPTDGLMFSAASSALVEAAANATEAAIVAEAAVAGLHTNWRYSPGYGDLPLEVQPAFLTALDASRRLGLSVTATNLLVPTKSVTAVVGLFDRPQAGADVRSACGTCQLRSCCQLRKRGTTCHG